MESAHDEKEALKEIKRTPPPVERWNNPLSSEVGRWIVVKGVGQASGQVVNQQQIGQDVEPPEAQAESALKSFGEEIEGIKQKHQAGERSEGPNAFDWRGNTDATGKASAFGRRVGQDYFENVIAPALSEAISIPDALAEVNPAQTDQARLQANIDRMIDVYQNFIGLFTEQSAARVPPLLAKFCAELYSLALEKGMEQEQAYLLVSGIFFLRTINPMLTNRSVNIPEGRPGKKALLLLATLLQSAANDKDEYRGLPTHKEQIRQFMMAVIARGQQMAVPTTNVLIGQG